MIYLACPYSHEYASVREQRYQLCLLRAIALLEAGESVFSPILHSHVLATKVGPESLPWEAWAGLDIAIVKRCSVLEVIVADGWKDSVGVQAEIREARCRGIEIRYVQPRFEIVAPRYTGFSEPTDAPPEEVAT